MASNTHSIDFELSSSQYAYCADNADVSVTGDITIECWVKPEQLASTAGSSFILVSKYDVGLDKRSYRIAIHSDDDDLSLTIDKDGNGVNTTTVRTDSAFLTVDDVGNWVHFSVNIDISENSGVVCKNGSAVSSTTSTAGTGASAIDDNDSKFIIGAWENNGSSALYFDGKIDEVRLWKDIRTASEISTYWKADVSGQPDLAGYWKFNNDLTDSEKSSDLTGVNSPTFSTDVPFATYEAGAVGNALIFAGGVVIG